VSKITLGTVPVVARVGTVEPKRGFVRDEPVVVTEDDGVFTATLDRPQKLNAIDLPTSQALDEATWHFGVASLGGNRRRPSSADLPSSKR
jgi:hypothetical protein